MAALAPVRSVLVVGSGLIGVDLVRRMAVEVPGLDVVVVGRSAGSSTRRVLEAAGAHVVTGTLDDVDPAARWDLVVDASDAVNRTASAGAYRRLAERVVDLTPSGLGVPVFPVLTGPGALGATELALVSCGAQAGVPVLSRLAAVQPLRYAELVTSAASAAAGRATRANIDEYIFSTQNAVTTQCAGSPRAKVMVNVSPGRPRPPFRVKVYAEPVEAWRTDVEEVLGEVADDISRTVPGYALKEVSRDGDVLKVGIEVIPAAPWVPRHCGSVEIITANAVEIISRMCREQDRRPGAGRRKEDACG